MELITITNKHNNNTNNTTNTTNTTNNANNTTNNDNNRLHTQKSTPQTSLIEGADYNFTNYNFKENLHVKNNTLNITPLARVFLK